jgi:Tfp pilus assembly protein PilN
MIEINLNPNAGKKKSPRRQSVDFSAFAGGFTGKLRDKFLIGALVAVAAAGGAGAFMYTSQEARASDLNDHKDRAIKDSTRYAIFLKDRMRAQSVRDTLLREVNVIRSLDDDRFIWPHVLDEVSRALPQYTWITNLTFTGAPQGSNNVVVTPKAADEKSADKTKKAPKRIETDIPKDAITVRVVGRTVDIQALTRFMKDLAASPFFENVQLEKSELAIDQGKEVTQFQLTVGFKRPDSTVVNRVPLNISGR